MYWIEYFILSKYLFRWHDIQENNMATAGTPTSQRYDRFVQ